MLRATDTGTVADQRVDAIDGEFEDVDAAKEAVASAAAKREEKVVAAATAARPATAPDFSSPFSNIISK